MHLRVDLHGPRGLSKLDRMSNSRCNHSNLAKLYHLLGRNDEAEALFIRSLDVIRVNMIKARGPGFVLALGLGLGL